LTDKAALESDREAVDVDRLRELELHVLRLALLAVPARVRRAVQQVLLAVLSYAIVQHARHAHNGHEG